jgi:hypothetical protein
MKVQTEREFFFLPRKAEKVMPVVDPNERVKTLSTQYP